MPRKSLPPSDYDGSAPLANARHEAFCMAYVGEFRGNAAASYRAAGYKTKKTRTDAVCAAEILVNPNIRRRVDYLEHELAEKEKLKAIDAVRHLKAVATVTLADFLDSRGRVDVERLRDPALAQAIQELTPIYDKEGCIIDYRIGLKDSMRALELLGLTERKEEAGGVQQVLVIKI